MAAHVLPMLVSLISTPFIIRMLGSEPYGVLILIGLIPTYLGFADFGMNLASTRFASEAYAAGDDVQEARIIRTAALIAMMSSLPFAAGLFLLSTPIVQEFNVPDYLLDQASVALKFASATFVIGFLNSILSTPLLTRIRMDLSALANTVPRVLMTAATPIVLYLGGGILEAAILVFASTTTTFIWQVILSAKLLPNLIGLSVDRKMFRPLLGFGAGLLIAMIASTLLVNLEKILLTSLVSVESLAYYSIAFTFSTMTSLLSFAMIQALLPAFSQLLGDEKRALATAGCNGPFCGRKAVLYLLGGRSLRPRKYTGLSHLAFRPIISCSRICAARCDHRSRQDGYICKALLDRTRLLRPCGDRFDQLLSDPGCGRGVDDTGESRRNCNNLASRESCWCSVEFARQFQEVANRLSDTCSSYIIRSFL
jgi:hypothetical protein